ncbi:hypothetical protein [uncultured Acidaminococcus sp.]|uniref:hypothetical protein n=1 Tax=uncultured Acidaminococcus sp. TaxID=352152 RepID=UPI002942C420|nr:hypothetical protein [uncultured Acidaminococcus sp.]
MARKKYSVLLPWETAKKEKGPEPQYIHIGVTLLQHPAFTALKPGARLVYFTMVMAAAGKREFNFPRACYTGKYKLSHNVVCKAIPELVKGGFIQVKQSGKNTRTPNIYEFVNTWKEPYNPP